MPLSSKLKEIARRKRAQQASSIPPEWRLDSIPSFLDSNEIIPTCGVLSSQDVEITSCEDARALRDKMIHKKTTCLAITTAYCKRAAMAQQLLGCCTEMFFERALERAKELDRILAETGRPAGPLHGVPVSIKDSFDVEGVDTTIGGCSRIILHQSYTCMTMLVTASRVAWSHRYACYSQRTRCGYTFIHGCRAVREEQHPAISNGASRNTPRILSFKC